MWSQVRVRARLYTQDLGWVCCGAHTFVVCMPSLGALMHHMHMRPTCSRCLFTRSELFHSALSECVG